LTVPARQLVHAAPPADSGAGPRRKASGWALPLRVASGVLFVPLLYLLARGGGWPWVLFVAVEVVLGLLEFYRMMRRKGLDPRTWLGIASALGLLVIAYRPESTPAGFLLSAALLLALGLALRHPSRPHQVENIAVTALGVLYVGWLSSHFVRLRELPWIAGTEYATGASFVFLAFLLTWSCDTGAYLVGRLWGRNRPWTDISPRKSMEGAIGGFACATLAAFAARRWFAPYLGVWDAAALGALVGVFGQVGDFVESLLKRDALHDDSSDLIPGHGGVLDRFDSLYFAAPVVYYYLAFVVFRVP
jgi:phosphatidate cytidylyltransferase